MGTVHPFPAATSQVGFERWELARIVDLYGRMVAAGMWKDYAIQFGREAATFWAFRRSAEHPEYKIEKRPALRLRQGMWSLIGEDGRILRRGHELGPVLSPVERRLLKVVND